MKKIISIIKNAYFNHSIHTNMLCFFVMLFTFVTLPSYFYFSGVQSKKNREDIVQVLNSNLFTSTASLNQTLSVAHKLSTSLFSSDAVQEFLSKTYHTSTDIQTLSSTLYTLCSSCAYPVSAYLFDSNYNCYFTDSNPRKKLISSFSELSSIRKVDQLGGKILCVNSDQIFYNANGISMIRAVNNIYTMEKIGYLIINIPIDTITLSFPDSADKNLQSFLFDSAGNDLLNVCPPGVFETIQQADTQSAFFSCTLQHQSYNIGFSTLESYGGYTLGYLYHPLTSSLRESIFLNYSLVLLFLNLLFLYIGIFFISRSVTRPIIALSESMSDISGVNDFHMISTPYSEKNELGRLVSCHNKMAQELDLLLTKEIFAEKHRRHLELNLLFSQIKPHFLYNTIDHVRILCLSGEIQEANQLLLAIGKYYKTILSKGNLTIPIRNEVDTIIQYNTILSNAQEVFYEIQYHIDPQIENMFILKFILQPLVENSIKHGLYGIEEGIISISFSLIAEDILQFSVSDNGHGMDSDLIEQILRQSFHSSSSGFGLASTLERIRLFYGSDCEISISQLSPGTEILITVHHFSNYQPKEK